MTTTGSDHENDAVMSLVLVVMQQQAITPMTYSSSVQV
jgi:hypothetical protein